MQKNENLKNDSILERKNKDFSNQKVDVKIDQENSINNIATAFIQPKTSPMLITNEKLFNSELFNKISIDSISTSPNSLSPNTLSCNLTNRGNDIPLLNITYTSKNFIDKCTWTHVHNLKFVPIFSYL